MKNYAVADALVHKIWEGLDAEAPLDLKPVLQSLKDLHELLGAEQEDELAKEGRVLSGRNESLLRDVLTGIEAAAGPLRALLEALAEAELAEKRGPVMKFDEQNGRYSVYAPILKVDDERRTVTGHVLAADVVDYQDDYIRSPEIWKAIESYMLDYQDVGIMHRELNPNLRVVEAYQAPIDFILAGQTVKCGDWLMTVKVLDDDIWARVKSGELRGFSIGGMAKRIKQDVIPDGVTFIDAEVVLARAEEIIAEAQAEPVPSPVPSASVRSRKKVIRDREGRIAEIVEEEVG